MPPPGRPDIIEATGFASAYPAIGESVHVATQHVSGSRLLLFSGDLTSRDVPEVRRLVAKALADWPGPVVCHLAGVRAFRAADLTVFPAVFAEAGGWPAVSLALMAPGPPLRDALRRVGIDRRVPLVDEAQLRAGPPPRGWRPQLLARSVPLPHDVHAAAAARHATADFCEVAGFDGEPADDAALIVSELVTNAVRHATPPVQLRLLASETALTIAVSDGTTDPPRPTAPGPRESGRGMAIVQALSVAWRSEPQPAGGKVVYARLAIRA